MRSFGHIILNLFRVRIALKMEAHALPRCEVPADFDRINPSHAKSEDGMEREERRNTRVSGRPGEGAVWGVSGATRRSLQLKSQQCSALWDPDATKEWSAFTRTGLEKTTEQGHKTEQLAQMFWFESAFELVYQRMAASACVWKNVHKKWHLLFFFVVFFQRRNKRSEYAKISVGVGFKRQTNLTTSFKNK